ncbi:MAG: metallopeptidase TldD-related protein [Bacteroidota bacterium]
MVNFVADKKQLHSLGAVGYDDEGVQCGQWDIIKDGILVNYQTIRDQAHILNLNASQGCCYADNWGSVQISADAKCFTATRQISIDSCGDD